jgi:hypothetical protein
MHYVVQDNIFRDINYNNLIIALDRLKLSYEIVSVYGDRDDIQFDTDKKNVFPFGGLKMARISNQYNWTPGTQMNDQHDYEVYKEYYKDFLLNYDSVVINFGDDIPFADTFFTRPTLDTKTFTGKVFTRDEWLYFRDDMLKHKRHSLLTTDAKIQVCSVKEILQEVRVWIVKGKVVTASQYKLGKQVLYEEYRNGPVIDFANEMTKLYQLNDAFVMDIADTKDGYKIIECNCINCSGFYKADLQKLLMELEYAFDEKEVHPTITVE